MKKILLPLLAVALFVSCDNKKDQEIEKLKEEVAYLKGAVDQQNKQTAPASEAAAAAPAAAPQAVPAAAPQAAPAPEPEPAPSRTVTDASNPNTPGANVFFSGSISVYNDVVFTVTGGSGVAQFGGQERTVKFSSYNPSTHKLVYKAYLKGSYIGDYVGTYRSGRYKGTFNNKKNGGKVNFDLYEFND